MVKQRATRKKMAAVIARRLDRYLPPKSLQEALENGWEIDEQLATWEFRGNSNKREGFLFLTKRGAADRLMIPFLALYTTRRPHFLGEKPQ